MIQIQKPTSLDELAELRRAWLASLAAPCDGMWESFANGSQHWQLRSAGELAGYFCVNDEGQILQFHVKPRFEPSAAELFAATIAEEEVKGAMVSTADALFLSLCLDSHRGVKVHTYLYQDPRDVSPVLDRAAETTLDVVEATELDAVAELQRESLDADLGDWLVGYLSNLIERRELHALRLDGDILATGETRVSDSQPPYVDLGVITMKPYRGRGVAAYILWRLQQLCLAREQMPICSTTVDNPAAQRAIAKAGFISRHRLLKIRF